MFLEFAKKIEDFTIMSPVVYIAFFSVLLIAVLLFSFLLYKKNKFKLYVVTISLLTASILCICCCFKDKIKSANLLLMSTLLIFLVAIVLIYFLVFIKIISKGYLFYTWTIILLLFVITCLGRIIILIEYKNEQFTSISILESIQITLEISVFGDLKLEPINSCIPFVILNQAILSSSILLGLLVTTTCANIFLYERYSQIKILISEVWLSIRKHTIFKPKYLYEYIIFTSLTEGDIEYCKKLKKIYRNIIFYGDELPKFDNRNRLCRTIKENGWLYISSTSTTNCIFDNLSIKHKQRPLKHKIFFGFFMLLSIIAFIITSIILYYFICPNNFYNYVWIFVLFSCIVSFTIIFLIVVSFHNKYNYDICVISGLRNEMGFTKSTDNVASIIDEYKKYIDCMKDSTPCFNVYFNALIGDNKSYNQFFNQLSSIEKPKKLKIYCNLINLSQLSVFDLIDSLNRIDNMNYDYFANFDLNYIGFGQIGECLLNTMYSIYYIDSKNKINCFDEYSDVNNIITSNSNLNDFIIEHRYMNLNISGYEIKSKYRDDVIDIYDGDIDDLSNLEDEIIKVEIHRINELFKHNIGYSFDVSFINKMKNQFYDISLGNDDTNILYFKNLLHCIIASYEKTKLTKKIIIAVNIKNSINNSKIESIISGYEMVKKSYNYFVIQDEIDILIYGNMDKILRIKDIFDSYHSYIDLWIRYNQFIKNGESINEESVLKYIYSKTSLGELEYDYKKLKSSMMIIKYLPYLYYKNNHNDINNKLDREQNLWCKLKMTMLDSRLIETNEKISKLFFDIKRMEEINNKSLDNIKCINLKTGIINIEVQKNIFRLKDKLKNEFGFNDEIIDNVIITMEHLLKGKKYNKYYNSLYYILELASYDYKDGEFNKILNKLINDSHKILNKK